MWVDLLAAMPTLPKRPARTMTAAPADAALPVDRAADSDCIANGWLKVPEPPLPTDLAAAKAASTAPAT